MARGKCKCEAWWKCYYNVLNKVEKKYPSMSKQGQRIRAWKSTNAIFRDRARLRREREEVSNGCDL